MFNFIRGFIAIFFLLGLTNLSVVAQQSNDTISLSLIEAEKIFLERNYQLLAQRFNISSAQANITQAKLWYNPTVFFETNFYNPATKKVFNYGKNVEGSGVYNNGEFQASITQLVSLAAKRSKLVRLAESNRQLQALAFEDLLRNLRFNLYTSYSELYYDQQSYILLLSEERLMKEQVEVFKQQLSRGAVSAYDVTRLEFELQTIQTSITDYLNQIADDQIQLQLILRIENGKYISPNGMPQPTTLLPNINHALDSAMASRPDVKLSLEQINNAGRNLNLQKANAIPDFTFGGDFDSYGNAYPNYSGVNVSFQLPIFNRNQGNLKIAQIGITSSKKALEAQQFQINSEVKNAHYKLKNFYNLVNNIPTGYRESLANISIKAAENYNKRIIGLLEFLDKIRSYKTAQLNLINMQNNLFQSQQYFNFVTNSKFF